MSLHDNDLVPFDASPAERDRIVARFSAAVADAGMCVPMATNRHPETHGFTPGT